MTDDKVLLGRIGGAHGLRGEVKIATFTAAPEDITAYGPLSSADGTRVFVISGMRAVSAGSVIARLKGVADRTQAEALNGIELYVSRDALPPPDDKDEFYYSDLIGLAAVSPDGDVVGKVIGVHNFGAGDLIEVRFDGDRQPVLIPFDNAHVPHVDLGGGRVTVVRPSYEGGEGEGRAAKKNSVGDESETPR
ncbi:ribosome maturation factor RimM [Rhodomicrobium lacus]|uniref:ribosome maturation factor RimM n=1 Tax=Rhodomicrobium lacus TaxID=2498452 RepID=UPI000F8E106A|nr:ribosome maturation factor RimM [Rhodomicrobium lacus]